MRLPHFDLGVTTILRLMLLLTVPLFVLSEHHVRAVVAVFAIIVSYVPAMVKHNYNVTMPWLFEFFITILLLTHLAGLYFDFYASFWWWDNAAHLLGSAVVAALGFYFVYALQQAGKLHLSIRMMAFFAIIFAIAIGALWEIGEYSSDRLLHTENQLGNTDTMTDLINDTLAGIGVAFIGIWYIRKEPEKRIQQEVETHLTHIKEEHRL